MEDCDEFYLKPSQLKLTNKRRKYGSGVRCGTTLRRHTVAQIQKSRDHLMLLKHVATTSDWLLQDIEAGLQLDDGGLTCHGLYKNTRRRGKSARSIVAQHPGNGALQERNSSYVTYSMNKRKRWLLPDKIKEEIEREKICGISDENIDLTVVEREVGVEAVLKNPSLRPDTVSLASSTLQDKENFPKPKKRRNKRKNYSWSTDLLGLSQKTDRVAIDLDSKLRKTRQQNKILDSKIRTTWKWQHKSSNSDQTEQEQVSKPEVTYEVCRTRTAGPYRDRATSDIHHKKQENKRRRRKNNLLQEADDNVTTTNDNNDDEVTDVTSCLKRSPPSMMMWVDRVENGKSVQHHVKSPTRNSCKTSHKSTSKKGRVIYMPDESFVMEKNKQNSKDATLSDEYFDRILENEKASTVTIDISLNSLMNLYGMLSGNGEKTCTFRGLSASKSRSHPLQFAFQINQASDKLANVELETPMSYFILQPLSDPRKCSNKENCFYYSGFCICNQQISVLIKVIMLSAEECHQKCVKAWGEKVKKIFSKQNSACPGMYLNKIINIITDAFTHVFKSQNVNVGKIGSKKRSQKIGLMLNSKRKVIDQVSTLLGFSVKPVNEADFHSKGNGDEIDLITNRNPKDFCEICWNSLSAGNKDYRALSLTQCRHCFCYDCWMRYLTALTRSSATQTLRCPGYGCDVVIDDVTLMSLLPGDILAQYQSRLLKHKVTRSKNFHQCLHCNKIVEVTNTNHPKLLNKAVPLSCACGARWCSNCKEEPHWPASCAEADAYRKEVEALNNPSIVRTVDGKRCPSCHEPIEKNGGCQIVRCICGFSFCWNCLKSCGICNYKCKRDTLTIETWDLATQRSSFVQAVQDAVWESKTFESQKTRRRRLAACQRKSLNIAAASTSPQQDSCHYKYLRREIESWLHEVLLHCDSLHYIMQYLSISVFAMKKRKGRNPCGKLRRFLMRLQLFVANIEQSIFDESSVKKAKLEHLMEKKITASKTLLYFLIIRLNQLPAA